MDIKLYCFALVFLTIATAFSDALDCYTCANATYVSECKSATTCKPGEICFSDHIHALNGMLYSFGCRAEAKCSSIIQSGNGAGSGSIVGRSASTGACSECCKDQHCNRQLCQHSFSDEECSDGTEVNCKSVGSILNICSDTQHAKTVCERFCGLCDYDDGSWSTWLTWSSCDVTCGNGTQTRIRKCTKPSPSGGGHDCAGKSQEARTCLQESCPVHGAWTPWNTWGSCSATCGIGLQRRDRSCSAPFPGRHGNPCFGDSRDDQICLANTCHDGGWSSWHTWDTCSRTCGDGIRSRSRSCDSPLPSIQGKYCPGEPYQVDTCNMQSCLVTNGGWGSWTSWTSCTSSCNGGIKSRQRNCNNPKPSADGDFCNGSPMDVQMCNQQHCPINGNWTQWNAWSNCNVTCDRGVQTRIRSCTNPVPAYGGYSCSGNASETKVCQKSTCQDGGWSSWSSWGACSDTCGGGVRSQSRTCTNPKPSILGKSCDGNSIQVGVCNKQTCNDNKVAFTAYGILGTSSLVFPYVLENHGNGYDSSTGIFTCKIPGIYIFSFQISKRYHADADVVQCFLRKNSRSVLGAFEDPNYRYDDSTGFSLSLSGTFYLNTNDRVDVGQCIGISAVYTDQLSSFTGVLVTPT